MSVLAGNFEVTVTVEDGRTVVHPRGALDVATSGDFRERLNELIAAGATDLAVNLKAVTFVDSAGLGVLIGTLKRLQSMDGRFAIFSPSRGVRKVLDLTGLSALVEVR